MARDSNGENMLQFATDIRVLYETRKYRKLDIHFKFKNILLYKKSCFNPALASRSLD
jgi:hypothetical protein